MKTSSEKFRKAVGKDKKATFKSDFILFLSRRGWETVHFVNKFTDLNTR